MFYNQEYIDALEKQFLKAKRNHFQDENEERESFINWLKDLREETKKYRDLLENNGFSITSEKTLEFNKGFFDSISSGKTLVVSKYGDTLDHNNAKLIVEKGKVLVQNENEIYGTYEDGLFLTHNPYTSHDVNSFIKLVNYGKKAVLGFYGKEDDQNRQSNKRLIYHIKHNYNNYDNWMKVRSEYYKDNYFYYIYADNSKKKFYR